MKYDNLVSLYLDLEYRLQEITNIIPYNENNKTVIIPKLSSIIVEAGSLLDTAFYEFYDGDKTSTLRINNYKTYYKAKLNLHKRAVIIYTDEMLIYKPYEEWENKRVPTWWNDYNKLKHDRLSEISKSTLENAINVLSGLLVFISLSYLMFDSLYKANLIITHTNPQIIKENFAKYIDEDRYAEYSIETEMFLFPIGFNILDQKDRQVYASMIPSNVLRRKIVSF